MIDSSQLTQALEAVIDSLQHRSMAGRALVFWYDPKGDFAEVFDGLALAQGVEKLRLEHRPFWVKYHLLVEKPTTSFVIYAPYAEPQPQENWLLDLQFQGELFSADRAEMLWRQYGLLERNLQQYLRQHLSFFSSKQRSAALDAIGLEPDSQEADLRLAMMSALAGLKVADPNQLLRKLLAGGLSPDDNTLYTELTRHFAESEIWELVAQTLGYKRDNPSLRDLFISLALTHMAQQLKSMPESLAPKVIRPPTRGFVFVDQWLKHIKDAEVWEQLSSQIAVDLDMAAIAKGLAVSDYLNVETFEDFDKVLIEQAVKNLCGEAADPQLVSSWIAPRKVLHWYSRYERHYQALVAATELLRALPQLDLSGNAQELWRAYSARYFQLDRHYRHYLSASDRASASLEPLSDKLERVYTQGFLEPLAEAWSDATKDLQNWEIPGAERQWRFFQQRVLPILQRNEREKVFVLISDAMRYEVAFDLQGRLMEELRGELSLSALQGVVPSITKLGMAALLPGTTLSIDDKVAVQQDGHPTQSTLQRQEVLNRSGYSSLALTIDDLLALSRDEGRQRLQAHRLIYIYQNVIDARGDKPSSEREVFDACVRAIEALTSAVRRVVNQFNGTHVLITSDHGFLYQRQALATHDKVRQPQGELIDSGRRYVLAKNTAAPDGTLDFQLPFLSDAAMTAIVPRGTLRYVLQGAGAQFVHGGSSLQEVCVPLLSYKHARAVKGDAGLSRKVGLRLNVVTRRVTNTAFVVRLIQDEPVAGRLRPRKISLQFVDQQGDAVTNSAPLLLDSEAIQATDREFIARFSVGATDLDRDAEYYLVVKDAEDDLEILRESWQFDLAFTDDFGDF